MTFKSLFGQITILSLSLVNFRVSRFHVSHLTHETFKLCLQNTLNMSKTARVYFGVLHSHPFHAMYLCINAMQYVIAYHHATYMSAICTCLLMHFNPCINWKLYQLTHKFQLIHMIHANISIQAYIDIISHYTRVTT